MTDPYQVLGVKPDATDDEVKNAYRELVRKYHPDKYAGTDLADMANEKMTEVNAAYDQIKEWRKSGGPYGNGASDRRQNGGGGFSGPKNEGNAGKDFNDVRRLINEGNVDEAYQTLVAMPQNMRGAEWYFLMGCCHVKYKRFEDASRCFDNACAFAPENGEYKAARDEMRRRARAYGAGYETTSTDSGCSSECMRCCCELTLFSICCGPRR